MVKKCFAQSQWVASLDQAHQALLCSSWRHEFMSSFNHPSIHPRIHSFIHSFIHSCLPLGLGKCSPE